MGNWNQDSSGLSDEDMDQSLQQDIAMAGAMADGAQTTGNYTFGGNFVNDADNPGYTGPSTNMNQAVTDMQSLFNTQRGITASNPYGKEGLFSRVLGIDPSKIDYSANMNLNTRMGIANNQFSKYMNPQNVKGQIGYNPAYDPAGEGKLRAGVQDAGYQTVYGPVMEQARKQGTGEMLARGAMGLAGGPIGMALAQIGTKEYGLPGVTGFERFDPNNPNPGGGILGQFLGGLNPTQAKDALVGAFAPVVPAPEPTSIGTPTSALNSWSAGRDAAKKQALADAVSSVMSQAQTSPSIANMSLEDKKTAIRELAERNFQPYLDAMPDMGATSFDNTLQPGFSRTRTETLPDGRTITVDEETGAALGTNLFGGQQSSLQNTVAGEQLAGSLYDTLFRDPNISPEARGILKEKGMTIDDLFAPKVSSPVEEKPDIMDLIEKATQTSALGGSSTADQIATVDYSNLKNVGGNLYQPVPETSAFDSFLERFGMKERKRRSSGQIYSPNKSRSFFDNPVGYLLGS